MDNKSYCNIDVSGSETLIISFTAHGKAIREVHSYDFFNFLQKFFSTSSRYFYTDKFSRCYHKGIQDKTTNIDETIGYLKNEIRPYKRVIFMGISSGGYAAILFGSLLGVSDVLAFVPQTILRKTIVDEKYRDISKYINDTTRYYLYGESSITDELDCHHISHCERISHHPNVYFTKNNRMNVKDMRDNGELYKIMDTIINRPDP